MNTGPSVLNKIPALVGVAALMVVLLGCGSDDSAMSEPCSSAADCKTPGRECNRK